MNIKGLTYVQLFVIAIILLLPLLFPTPYYLQLFSIILMFSIYSISWNILASSGQVSLGHAAFFGIGAYASVILSKQIGIPVFLTVFLGPLVAALLGLGIGIIVLRLREWFLSMVTFGIPFLIEAIVVDDRARFLTEGWTGIFAKPLIPSSIPNHQFLNYYVLAIITIAVYLFSIFIFNSKLGFALRAIEENETLAKASGINVTLYKIIAFVISTYLAGLAGAIYVHSIALFVSPEIFNIQNSFWPLIFTLAGGIRTTEGPILGSFVVWIAWQGLGGITGYYSLIGIGILLAVIILIAPRGLYSLIKKTIIILQDKLV